MERIISDTFAKKNKHIWGDDPGTPFNQKILAVNDMYGWLYEQGILERASFIFKDYDETVYFALDAKDLAPYRKEMESAPVNSALLAVQHIFDIDYTPCRFSGLIELGWTMSSYRSVDGMVSSSWECRLAKELDYSQADEVRQVLEKEGPVAAAKNLYSRFQWNEPNYEKSPTAIISPSEKDRYAAALQHFSKDFGVAVENDYVIQYAEELVFCHENNKSLIDFDFWTRYEDLCGEKLSYEEYLAVDRLYDGDPHDIRESDTELIESLKAGLKEHRAKEPQKAENLDRAISDAKQRSSASTRPEKSEGRETFRE